MSLRERSVVPGDPLASIEEYLPGEGTYVDEAMGLVRSAVAGTARYDVVNKVVSVRPARRVRMPGPGSTVVGVVYGVRHDIVIVELYGQAELQPRPRLLWEFSGKYSGAISIANIADEFIKDTHDYYRIGDVVVARALNRGNPYHLTTKAPQYGVVYAQCARCGAPLEPASQRTMRCPRCGNVEKRKVSAAAASQGIAAALKRVILIPHF